MKPEHPATVKNHHDMKFEKEMAIGLESEEKGQGMAVPQELWY